MSSISNGKSMHEDDPRPRRLPWRPLVVLILLGTAFLCMQRIAMPALHAWQTAQGETELALAGLAAEEVEAAAIDGQGEDARYLTDLLTPLVHSEPAFAYMRIWNAAGEPVCVVMQDEVTVKRLPPFAADTNHGEDDPWLGGISHLQELVRTQRDISDLLANIEEQGTPSQVQRNSLYVLQDDTLQLAETRVPRYPQLATARQPMQAVLDALTADDEEAFARGAEASAQAEEVFSLTLEGTRARRDDLTHLPVAMAKAAPPAESWPGHLWPGIRGRRVSIPLFVPGMDDRVLESAGTAEVVFYAHPSDALAATLPGVYPALACLMLALAITLRRRRTPSS